MTTAEFNERLKRVNSKHKLELSFNEYNEELVKNAMSFWLDRYRFINTTEDSWEIVYGTYSDGIF